MSPLLRPLGAVVLAAALTACASSTSVGPMSGPTTRTVAADPRTGLGTASGGLITLTPTHGSAVDSLAVPVTQAAAALRLAYEALGIAVTVAEPGGRVGNAQFTARGRLGSTELTRFVECGESVTGPRAARDRIYLSVLSTVSPMAGGRSAVRTTMSAQAMDMGGSSNERVPCTSTGALELEIHQRASTFAAGAR